MPTGSTLGRRSGREVRLPVACRISHPSVHAVKLLVSEIFVNDIVQLCKFLKRGFQPFCYELNDLIIIWSFHFLKSFIYVIHKIIIQDKNIAFFICPIIHYITHLRDLQ